MSHRLPTTHELIPILFAGLVTGMQYIVFSISLIALIFSGQLAVFLPRGIGIALFSTMMFCVLLSLTSGFRGLIAVTQDGGVAILVVFADQVTRQVADPTADSTFITIMVLIALSSFFTGLFFIIVGRFRLGNLIRFIPYPVVGGFLAAVGLIIFQGAFVLLTNHNINLTNLAPLFASDVLPHWIPALLFGVLLFIMTRRRRHYLIVPAMLMGAVILFLAVVLVSGESLDEVQRAGWMLGPFPDGGTWKPLFLDDLSVVDWDIIFNGIGHIPTIALVSAIGLLLNMSALETRGGDEVDINSELQLTGAVNMGLAGAGVVVGYHSLGGSLMAWRIEGKHRLVGVIFGLVFLVVMVFGFSLIAYFPRFVLAGLLIFQSIDILAEWLYQGWYRMPRQDYAAMLVILFVIGTVGYLEGVGLGILVAAMLFTFNYSRVEIVKHTLTSKTYQSKVDRPTPFRRQLYAAGERLTIYQLDGFIFFGSANNLLDRVLTRLADPALPPLGFLVLDFQRVKGVDSSAVLTFIKLRQLLARKNITLAFSGLSEEALEVLRRSAFPLEKQSNFRLFSDVDEAIEWCEDQMLRDVENTNIVLPGIFKQQFAILFPDLGNYEDLLPYMERVELAAGEVVAEQGDPSDSVFFVESGKLRAQIQIGKLTRRVRTASAGTIIGEVALYSGDVRTATIIADEPSVVFVLSKNALDQMEQEKPIVAANFHKFVARVLAERLADTTNSLRHVLG